MLDVQYFLFFDQTGCLFADLRRAQPNRGRHSFETTNVDGLDQPCSGGVYPRLNGG